MIDIDKRNILKLKLGLARISVDHLWRFYDIDSHQIDRKLIVSICYSILSITRSSTMVEISMLIRLKVIWTSNLDLLRHNYVILSDIVKFENNHFTNANVSWFIRLYMHITYQNTFSTHCCVFYIFVITIELKLYVFGAMILILTNILSF